MPDDLRQEAERILREQAMVDRDMTVTYDLSIARPPMAPGMIAPTNADLLPHPPSFKTIDIEREISAVRDARKRIRLEPSVLTGIDPDSPQATGLRARALPSICAYTLHDVPEGYLSSLIAIDVLTPTSHHFSAPCITFSQDTSLMAAGFAESYIRLWSLRGEKLRGFRNDFSTSAIKDCELLYSKDSMTLCLMAR